MAHQLGHVQQPAVVNLWKTTWMSAERWYLEHQEWCRQVGEQGG